MSADRYSPCIKCADTRKEEATVRRAEADAAYGSIPIEEWKKLDQRAKEMEDYEERGEGEFREGWEIGMHKGKLLIDYYGCCGDCGFIVAFKRHLDPFTETDPCRGL